MEIYTIGFTKKSAEQFFGIIQRSGVQRLIDIRLNNRSQLSSFAKQPDLEYFLKAITKIEYVHEPLLCPTENILKDYQKKLITWDEYENKYIELIKSRAVEKMLSHNLFEVPSVLLCSESEPNHCHRRIAVEYLKEKWGNVDIKHL